jgi:Fic family protein
MIHGLLRNRLEKLLVEYIALSGSKKSLLKLVDESELAETVFNSNAIENSTLTLQETERVLLQQDIVRNTSLREVFEAKNLAQVITFLQTKKPLEILTTQTILFLHKLLLTGINDDIAGRFRKPGEYVRVGRYVAPAPELVETKLINALSEYYSNTSLHPIDAIAKFHLEFETIHPFIDGNGRIGRVLINYLLIQKNYPQILIYDKDKLDYYATFTPYQQTGSTRKQATILALLSSESLNKRLAYLKSQDIIRVSQYAKNNNLNLRAVLNQARAQTFQAFRIGGKWMMGN